MPAAQQGMYRAATAIPPFRDATCIAFCPKARLKRGIALVERK